MWGAIIPARIDGSQLGDSMALGRAESGPAGPFVAVVVGRDARHVRGAHAGCGLARVSLAAHLLIVARSWNADA